MSNLPSLNEFLKAEKQKRVSAHRCGKLVGFKYTNETIYAQDWDEVTLNARGIVFDETTGDVVARPFKKFFNYQEFFDGEGNHSHLYDILPNEWKPNLTGNARYMEKVDGSLGIVFWNPYTNKWQLKTGGSFDSAQAIWAQKWFDEHIDSNGWDINKTYLFEIVYHDDIHPIKYDYEGLVLLSIIDNVSGNELPLSEIVEELDMNADLRMVKIYDFSSFNEAVEWAKKQPKTVEGLVITFDNGFKTKAKSDDWCTLAKLFEGLNKWNIWICYDIEKDFFHAHVDKHNNYKPVDDEVLFIPEELPEIREYAEYLRKTLETNTNAVLDIANKVKCLQPERRKQFEYVHTNYKETWPEIMKALDYFENKCNISQVKQIVYKKLEPEPEN